MHTVHVSTLIPIQNRDLVDRDFETYGNKQEQRAGTVEQPQRLCLHAIPGPKTYSIGDTCL